MKKITFLSLALAICTMFSVSAKNTKLGAGAALAAAITTAADGDTITLTSASVYTVGDYQAIGSIVLQGDPTLPSKPIVKEITPASANGLFAINNAASPTFDNLILDANGNYRVISAMCDVIGDISVTNCDIINYVNCAIVSKGVTNFSKSGSIYVENCTATGVGMFLLSGSAAGSAKSFKDIYVINCLIKGAQGPGNVGASEAIAAYEGSTGKDISLEPETMTISHCSFVANNKPEFRITTVTSTTITDCIFANNPGTGSVILGQGNWDTKCAVYMYGPDYLTFKVCTDQTKLIQSNPQFDVNSIATATPYVNQGSDGKTIGYYNAGQIKTALKTLKATSFKVYQHDNDLVVRGASESSNYQIIDMRGSQVKANKIANGVINISSLNSGVYMLRIGAEISKFAVR